MTYAFPIAITSMFFIASGVCFCSGEKIKGFFYLWSALINFTAMGMK